MESQITSRVRGIALADDHPILLDGLQFLFRQQADIEVVARCETAEEALSHVGTTRPDVLVLDVRMPGKDGLWVLEQLADDPGTRVVLLTAGVENCEIARALTLGARGVVLKDRTGEDLVRCVRTVYSGGDGSMREFSVGRWILSGAGPENQLLAFKRLLHAERSRSFHSSPRDFEIERLRKGSRCPSLRSRHISARSSPSCSWPAELNWRSGPGNKLAADSPPG